MATHNVTKDSVYLITAKTETTVTDVETGYVLGKISAGTQARVVAISEQFTTNGECIVRPFEVTLAGNLTGEGGSSGEVNVDLSGFAKKTDTVLGEGASGVAKNYSVALGTSAKTNGSYPTAIGSYSNAVSNCAIAIGYNSRATAPNTTSAGVGAEASATNSIALGSNARALGSSSISLKGYSSNSCAISIGDSTEASGENAIAIGHNNRSYGIINSIAIGTSTIASDECCTAMGCEAKASGVYGSTAIGTKSLSSSRNSTAIGCEAVATQNDEHVFGSGASGLPNSVALVATNAESQTRLRFVAQTVGTGINDNCFIFQYEDLLDPDCNSGIKIYVDDFFNMLKQYAVCEVYTESSEGGASS